MMSAPAQSVYATGSAASPVWGEAGGSVVQNDTAWLLSFIDILTLLLTLFVLLLAYGRNDRPAHELTFDTPQQQHADRGLMPAPLVESLETLYQPELPLTVIDWFSLLDPHTMSRADSIEALALDTTGPTVEPVSPADRALLPDPEQVAVTDHNNDVEPVALAVTQTVSDSQQPNSSLLPGTETPAMSLLPDAPPATEPVGTLQVPPVVAAVGEPLLSARIASRRETTADALRDSLGLALREQVEISLAPGAVNLEVSDNILFRPASAALTDAGYAVLDELAKALADQSVQLSVEGHTDNVPIETAVFPSNWELSSARAAVATRGLIARGIAADRIRAVGYGDTRPRADNVSVAGRAKNRRVSFVLQITE